MVRQGFLARAAAAFCALILTVSPVSKQVLCEEAATPDSTGTRTITGDDYRRWPVRRVEDWLALQPGVAVRYPGADNIYIRGAERYNSAYILNGTRIEDPMTGQLAATISPYAINHAGLRTSAFDGRLGDFTGGVVSISSAAWQRKLTGSVEVTSDYFGTGFDQNWYNAMLAGPLGNNTGADFFVTSERRYLGDRQPSPIAEDVLPGGEKALPGNSLEGWSHHGKITWAPCEKGQITLWGDYSRDNYQTYRHEWYYFPEHAPRTEDEMLSLGLGMERELSSKVTLDVKAKYYRFERTHGDGVVFDDLAAYKRGAPNPGYDQYNIFREEYGGLVPYYDYLFKQKAGYSGIDAAVHFVPWSRHRVTVGVEAYRYAIRKYEHLGPTISEALQRVNAYGYDLTGEEIDSDSWRDGAKHPVRGGLYAQDRVTGEDYTVTGAIRVDYVDYSARVFRDPANPYGPTTDSEIDEEDMVETDAQIRLSPRLSVVWQPSEMLEFHSSGAVLWQSASLDVYNSIDFLEARIWTGLFYPYGWPPDKMQGTLLLEGGVKIRPTKELTLRAGAKYCDTKDIIELTHVQAVPTGYDVDANFGNGNTFQATAGLTFAPRPFLTLDLTYQASFVEASYTDISNIVWMNSAGSPAIVVPTSWDQTHKLVGVFDFHTGRGEGPWFGNSTLLENTSFVATIYAASGFRYTKTRPYDAVAAPIINIFPEPISTINEARQPMVFQIDLKLERMIPVGRFNVVPFVWIRNVLDRENVAYIYRGTGEPDVTGYLDTEEGQYRADDPNYGEEFLQQYLLRQNDPTNYAPPRQIYFGIRAEF